MQNTTRATGTLLGGGSSLDPPQLTINFRHILWGIALAVGSAACNQDDIRPIVANSSQFLISDSIVCNNCRIMVDTMVTVEGSLDVPFFLSTRLAYLTDRREFVAAPLVDPGRVALYDHAGRYLESFLGYGEGPGELQRVRHLIDEDGGRFVAINVDGRLVRYDLGSESAYDSRLPPWLVPNEFVRGPRGTFLAFTLTPAHPTGVVLDSMFRIIGSFGDSGWADAGGKVSISPMRLDSKIGGGNESYFVQAARRFQLRVRLWGSRGDVVADFLRDASWFPPYDEATFADSAIYEASQIRPFPEVIGTWMDEEGLVWIAGKVPDLNWQQLDPVVPGKPLLTVSPSGMPIPPDRDWDKFIDTVIEVIDPRRRVVLARTRVDPFLYRMIAPGILGGIGDNDNGETVLRAFSVRLVR